jgi:riboflavin kinase/FMN adenylyltransferase
MPHVFSLSDLQLTQPSLATIGVFDGVHRGHQALIEQLVGLARERGQKTVVLTFFPHPDIVLRGLSGRYYLTTPEQRAEVLLSLGVDWVVTQTFDEAFRHQRAEDYVNTLVEKLRLSELWVGQHFAMGYQREGTVERLSALGRKQGFSVQAIELVESPDNGAISSTRIREHLLEGEVEQATALLGRPFAIAGRVEHGQARGRTIGFPTANVQLWDEQVLPANGVYAGYAEVDGQRYKAVTNVGIRPTFHGQSITVEAHLLDFEGNLYEKTLSLSFVFRLRGEKKFDGLEALIAQITADVLQGRQLLP